MTTLNPDLLDSNTRAALNRASELTRQFGKPALMPELALLALLRMPQSTAFRAVANLAASRGFSVADLEKEVEAQIRARTGRAANFTFVTDQNSATQLSDEMVIALDEARSIALASGEIYIATEHLLGALSQTGVSTAGLLQRKGVTPTALASLIVDGIVSKRATTTDWVQQARQGQLPPLYYRETLLRDLVTLLSLAHHPHVILVGEPGSGRRSLAQSLALMIAEGKGPAHIRKVIEVSEAAWLDNPMLAMQVAMRQAENGVLFIPSIQRFLGGQLRADLPQAGKDLQKAFVADTGGPIIIGSTTEADYAERIRPNATIAGRAHVLRVPPATPDECQKMLAALRPQFERNYSMTIADDALKTATALAARYVGGAPLPGSAVQVLHRACAAVRATADDRAQRIEDRGQSTDNRQQTTESRGQTAESRGQTAESRGQTAESRGQTGPALSLDAEDVMFAVSLMTGIPVAKLGADERGRYAGMAQALQQRVIGQDEAIQAVSRAVKSARVGLKDPRRPIGSFLFLGPSGVGKTELAKALAEFLFGSEDNLVALDMTEYQKDDTINRLIGAPPGYIGFEGGGQLTDRILKSPYAVVLFDEVEKAHPRILDILLQVMEEGRLTDGQGRVANFAETVILLTSNLGAQYLNDASLSPAEARELAMTEVRSFFRPEFINRLDEIVMFNPLSPDSLRRILDLMIRREAKLAQERGIALEVLPAAREWMLAQNTEPHLGARPLRRILQRSVRDRLADYLLTLDTPPARVVVDADANGLVYHS